MMRYVIRRLVEILTKNKDFSGRDRLKILPWYSGSRIKQVCLSVGLYVYDGRIHITIKIELFGMLDR